MTVILNDDILLNVEKPGRYVGNEWNVVIKPLEDIKIRFAFCFPDTYEIGMSNLGMKIMYHLMNERYDTYCERVFAPWIDMEKLMRENDIPLFTLETKSDVGQFDFVGFTLQYEMSYTNILNMLDLSQIPLLSKDRSDDHPIVCAGGPCAFNPEPLAQFIDFFVIGDGEEVIGEVFDMYNDLKQKNIKRKEIIKKLASIKGVYVPALYDVEYFENKTIRSMMPVSNDIPSKIKKRVVVDLDKAYFPENVIVPNIDVVHNRIMLELFRGCTHGCRFCQAGFIYRPVRERSAAKLYEKCLELEKNTGYEELSLVSLSTSDYTELALLTDKLTDTLCKTGVNISLPSLRIDNFSIELMEKVQNVRKSGLTFAPEAGSQRLRDVINKGVTEQNLMDSVKIALEGGWHNIKLYFMLGLPGEEYEDISAIADLVYKIIVIYKDMPKEKKQKKLSINLSTSSFVPKPFTPFQWDKQNDIEELKKKQKFLKEKFKNKIVSYSWHDSKTSFLEALISRGDRNIGMVILKAWEKGCKFDTWSELFQFDRWIEAIAEAGIDADFYVNREREYDEILPWDHIDIGVERSYLINEREKAKSNELTKNCRDGCMACGASQFGGGVCYE